MVLDWIEFNLSFVVVTTISIQCLMIVQFYISQSKNKQRIRLLIEQNSQLKQEILFMNKASMGVGNRIRKMELNQANHKKSARQYLNTEDILKSETIKKTVNQKVSKPTAQITEQTLGIPNKTKPITKPVSKPRAQPNNVNNSLNDSDQTFNQALGLLSAGASVNEVVDELGISRAEADLMQVLHSHSKSSFMH